MITKVKLYTHKGKAIVISYNAQLKFFSISDPNTEAGVVDHRAARAITLFLNKLSKEMMQERQKKAGGEANEQGT